MLNLCSRFFSLFCGLCRLRTWRQSIQTMPAGSRNFSTSTTRRRRRSDTPLSCNLLPFLCVAGFSCCVCDGHDDCRTESLHLPLRNFVLCRMHTCVCTPVQEHLLWLHPPRCNGFKIPPMASLQMNNCKCTHPQLLLTVTGSLLLLTEQT